MLNLSKNVTVTIVFSAMFVFSSLSFSAPQDTLLEQQVRQAVKNSKVTVETRSDAVVAILPVDGGFHPKREGVLLPASLRPLTKIAKLVKQDNTLAVLIIGHTDDAGSIYVKQDVSEKRASSVGSIFRIAGITNKQMLLSGVGSTQPKVSNATKKGKALNQRVEIIILKKPYNQDLTALSHQYAANFNQ